MKPTTILRTLLVFAIIKLAIALETNAQTQFGGWVADFNTIKLGKKTSLHSDFQLRSTHQLKHTQTLLLRAGLNVKTGKKFTLTAGYAYIHNRRTVTGVSGYTPEHRLWQQAVFAHSIKRLSVSHRARLEQRFIGRPVVQASELQTNGSVYANRFRYFNRSVLPLRKSAAFGKGMFAALQNEVFINFGNTSTVNGEYFDQNRFYLATGYRLNPQTDLEIGYMNQYINGRGSAFTNNHIIQVAGYLRL